LHKAKLLDHARNVKLSELNMKSKLTILFSVFSLILVSTPLMAQEAAAGGDSTYFEDSFRDISIIGATAVGGAVLGLSTLSFVEEPGDHLKNIVVGAAVGIIIGVGLVAYMAASKSKGRVEGASLLRPADDLEFATTTRTEWHFTKHSANNKKATSPSMVGYQFTF
jgi:hypothetical protein